MPFWGADLITNQGKIVPVWPLQEREVPVGRLAIHFWAQLPLYVRNLRTVWSPYLIVHNPYWWVESPCFVFFLNRHILLAESPYFVAYESTCFLLNLRVLLSNSPFLMRTYITWWICFVSCKPSFLVEHPLWISISIRLNLSCLNPVSCVVSSCFLAKSPHFLCVVSPYFDAYIAMFKDESRCLSMLNLCWANVRTLVSLL